MPVLVVNLTAAYDTVISFKLDFNCKLLRFLLDKCVVRMIIKLIENEGFTLTATVSKIVSGVRETVFLQINHDFLTSRRIICSPQYPD